MIGVGFLYLLLGLLALGVAVVNVLDRGAAKRWNNAAFWTLYAAIFLAGSYLPSVASGVIVLAMVAVASVAGLGAGRAETATAAEREGSARRFGHRLFIPALIIPAVTLLGTFTLGKLSVGGAPLVDPRQVTLISLALATIIALALGMLMFRPPAAAPIREARRLWDAVGWAAVLPQMLAALGSLFATAGVGRVLASLIERFVPLGVPFVAVATYGVGMALFTMLMGNAFAAFPVMTAAVALPVLIGRFGADPAIVTAIGMLSGFCGTLMTPMAANFNIVPARLLELDDENAVIRAQIPTALPLLAANVVLMYLLAFRR